MDSWVRKIHWRGIGYPFQYSWASLVAQLVKNLPAMGETWVRSPGWEDPLEKGMATHFSILAWRIPWTEEPVRLQSIELGSDMTEQISLQYRNRVQEKTDFKEGLQ